MKYKSFAKKLDELERRLDLTATPVVMHFRITTHGGTKPENTHPFPITDSVGALKKLHITTDVGVAHNGIIHITPRKGISDTMEYIASQLAPLKRALPRFYENKHAMTLVKNAIDSRMAFLTREGKVYTVGDFIEDGGVLYSNSSYLKLTGYYRSCGTCYDWDDWYQWADSASVSSKSTKGKALAEEDDGQMLMWLAESDVVRLKNGDLDEGENYLIDEDYGVWAYDWDADLAYRVPGATALNAELMPVSYDEDEAYWCYTSPF